MARVTPTERPTTPVRRLRPGQAAALWGVVADAWAVFVFPLFFGAVGLVLGVVAWRRGERRGRWVAVAAVVCALAGIGIGLLPDKFVMN